MHREWHSLQLFWATLPKIYWETNLEKLLFGLFFNHLVRSEK